MYLKTLSLLNLLLNNAYPKILLATRKKHFFPHYSKKNLDHDFIIILLLHQNKLTNTTGMRAFLLLKQDDQKFPFLQVLRANIRAEEIIKVPLKLYKANNLIGIFDSHFQKPISVLMGY